MDTPHELLFIYTGNGENDIFRSKISRVNLYVFDWEDSLTDSIFYDEESLGSFQGAYLNLPYGEYRIICWGNVNGYSEITGENNYSSKRLYQSDYLDGGTIRNFDSLYYSSLNITIPSGNRSDTLFFKSAHIRMEIFVEGFDAFFDTKADATGLIEITNAYVGYDFEMNATGEKSDIYPVTITDLSEDIAFAEFNLLRFGEDNDIFINILDSDGEVRFSVNLKEFLDDNGIEIEGVNEIVIPIYIRFDDVSVSVSVADWNSNDVKPVF